MMLFRQSSLVYINSQLKSNTLHPTPTTRHYPLHSISCALCIGCTQYLVPCVPCTLHSAPYFLYSTPNTQFTSVCLCVCVSMCLCVCMSACLYVCMYCVCLCVLRVSCVYLACAVACLCVFSPTRCVSVCRCKSHTNVVVTGAGRGNTRVGERHPPGK